MTVSRKGIDVALSSRLASAPRGQSRTVCSVERLLQSLSKGDKAALLKALRCPSSDPDYITTPALLRALEEEGLPAIPRNQMSNHRTGKCSCERAK